MSKRTRVVALTSLAGGRTSHLLPSVTAGLITSLINLIVAISLAALIFAGDLASFVANGISLILLGGSVALVVTGMLSSASGTITVTQDAPAAILAVAAAASAGALPTSVTPEQKFLTVVALVVVTSLLTGLTFILLGYFKLGGLVRFLPYPVVGGFLAGTGWLLLIGGIGVMTDSTVDLAHIVTLFQEGVWQRWVPGLLLAIMMLTILNHQNNPLLLPSMLLGSTLLFYIVMQVAGKSLEQIRVEGWLVGPFPSGGLWHPLALTDLTHAQWSAILPHVNELASILLISVVSMLLNASGIELVIKRDLDLNRELWAAGVGSVLSGLLGGLVCFHALTDTSLNYRASGGSRLTCWITALFCLIPLVAGATLLSFVPKMGLGSLLVLLGLSFLWEWVYLAWSRFPLVEYLIILLILGVSATVGYLEAVQVGLLAAVALFVINYSRVNVVRHALSADEFHSRVTRGASQRQVLEEQGRQLYILQLQGFIFFGTAHNLVERVRARIGQGNMTPLRFVLLDFAQVTGLDSTAVLSFLKLKQVVHECDMTLLLTNLTPAIQRQLENGGVVGDEDGSVITFPDLDHGAEWCENKILAHANSQDNTAPTWQEQFGALLASPADADHLLTYLEPHDVPAGHYLIRAGELPNDVYFLTGGQLTAQLEQTDGTSVRLETMRAGRVVGEIGFYLHKQRTAAVVADEPTTVYRLSASMLERMEREAPEMASAFHQIIVRLLAERVSHLIVVVGSLQRKA